MYDYEDFDDDDDDDELVTIDLPLPELTFTFLISQFFIEADRKEKRVNREVAKLLDKVFEKHGDDYSAVSVMGYISRRKGWDMEILLEKHEVEDYLMRAYDLFDDDIWQKVLGTTAMSDLRREVFTLSQTYLTRAVREVLGRERPSSSVTGDPLL